MLVKLKLKFEDQKLDLEKEEMSTKANFQVLAQQLTDDIKNDSANSDKKTAMKAASPDDSTRGKGEDV